MFRYTDDPVADAAADDAALARLDKEVPVCGHCEKPIADDYYYLIYDEPICADCLDGHFRREVVID